MQPEDHQQFTDNNPRSSDYMAYKSEKEKSEIKYYFLLLAAQNDEEIEGYINSLLINWNDLKLLLTLFRSKKAACDYYFKSNTVFSSTEDTYIFSAPCNENWQLISRAEIGTTNVKTYIESNKYNIPKKHEKRQTQRQQHNDPIFISIIERLNKFSAQEKALTLLALRKKCVVGTRRLWLYKTSWGIMQEDYNAFKTFFKSSNRIITQLKPEHLLVLWKKFGALLTIETEKSGIDPKFYIHKSFFLASNNFVIELFAIAKVELEKNRILLPCFNLEMDIINSKLKRKKPHPRVSMDEAVKLFLSKDRRRELIREIIQKYKTNSSECLITHQL